MITRVTLAAPMALALLAAPVAAKVSQEEAEKLGRELTPVGAERQGNGNEIPEWTGGVRQPAPGWKPGGPRVDPFADDAKRFTIDADNVSQYADKLSPGQLALFEKLDGYTMDVYETRRSCAYPEFVYENTRKNATTAQLDGNDVYLKKGWGSYLFPIPTKGEHTIWNSQYAWFTEGKIEQNATFTPTKAGNFTPTISRLTYNNHFFDPKVEGLEEADGRSASVILERLAPPRQAGQVVLVHEMVNDDRRAWVYNPGQRRVRRTPTVGYDNPLAGTESLMTNDQARMFNGIIDRWNWEIVGKRELYIPYNVFELNHGRGVTLESAFGARYPRRDLIRYELHRVWVVEATLRDDKRHLFSKRVFYMDEDSWLIGVEDIYDKGDNLWRVMEAMITIIPELPTCTIEGTLAYDLVAGRYAVDQVKTAQPPDDWLAGRKGEIPQGIYTPDALRRLGRR